MTADPTDRHRQVTARTFHPGRVARRVTHVYPGGGGVEWVMRPHRCGHCARILIDHAPVCDSLCATERAGRPGTARRTAAAVGAWFRVRLRPTYPTR